MKTQQEIAEELRQYLLTKERTQRELAEKIGISTAHLSNYLRGTERISRKVADRMVELWPEIRLAFLLSGDGPLLRGGGNFQHLERVTNSGSIVNGGTDAALVAEVQSLREQLERERAEKARLLGIIETMTGK
jgi:transcriptional regulator with XRE-family HTH domain